MKQIANPHAPVRGFSSAAPQQTAPPTWLRAPVRPPERYVTAESLCSAPTGPPPLALLKPPISRLCCRRPCPSAAAVVLAVTAVCTLCAWPGRRCWHGGASALPATGGDELANSVLMHG
eukprot:6190817-Pleurochrysis_carterae.AAC.2